MGILERMPLTSCARYKPLACVVAILMLASLLAIVPLVQPARAQPAPPSNDCSAARAGVVVKLAQHEDRAAANMLAEALRVRGDGRCLVDAFASNARATAAGLRTVYVVGGTRAVSDSHVRNTLGRSSYTRIWGHDRWQTQSEVAKAILAIADGGMPRATPTSLRPTTYANDCRNTVVLVKLEQREDRAAANMLAEALRVRGDGRCLVDAFASNARTMASGRSVCVVGGTAAVSNGRIAQIGLNPSDVVRVAGADRWATQKAVAELILHGAQCNNIAAEGLEHLVIPTIADDAGVAFERLPMSIDRNDITIKAYFCGTNTDRRDAARNHVEKLNSAFARSDLNRQLEHNGFSLDFEWGGHVNPIVDANEAWNSVSLMDVKDSRDKYCWPSIENSFPSATELGTLIMADVTAGGLGGYSQPPNGPSYMMTREEYSNDDTFQIIALHEVTHTVYDLWHVWGRDNDPKCLLFNLDDHDNRSVLSYANRGGCERRMTLAGSYLACGMLMIDANKDDDPYFQDPPRHSDFINAKGSGDEFHYRYGGLDFYDTRQECIDDNNGKGQDDDSARPVRKPKPSGAVTISWGGDATQQRSTNSGQIFCQSVQGFPAPYTCRNLTYQADREILGEPYEADRSTPRWTLTCGIDGHAYQPFYWAGDSSTGCLYYAGQLGKATFKVWVEINGYRSNEITWPPPPPECDPAKSCYEDDNPDRYDEVATSYDWLQPDGNTQNHGYDHDFWFTLAWGNSDITDNWARWEFLDVSSGTYDVRVHVPLEWATAHCRYVVKRNGVTVATVPLDQQAHAGRWATLGRFQLSGSVRVEVYDNDCREDHRVVGPAAARLAVDAIRLQAGRGPEPPQPSAPSLSVTRGGLGIAGSCTASAMCEWVHGTGSGWTPNAQFWIKCGDFVDTSRNHPVPYRDRYVDGSGNLAWGDRVCLSNGSHTVEVWTNFEGPVRTTIGPASGRS